MIKYLSYLDSGANRLRMSNPHCMNDQGDVRMCNSVDEAFKISSCCWHWSHFFMYSWDSWTMVDQKYPSLNIFLANALAPKCFPIIPSCTSKRTKKTSHFPKHFINGVYRFLLYKSLSILVCSLARLFTWVTSEDLMEGFISQHTFKLGSSKKVG